MGIIAGLIGVSIVANAISDTVVEKQRVQEQAKVEAERIRAQKEIKTAKIHSKAIVKAAKINAQSEVAQTGMKTGFFASLFGVNNGQKMLDNGNSGWTQVSSNNNYIPQSTTSYIPQKSTFTAPGTTYNRTQVGYYNQNGYSNETIKPMFCRYCGTKHDPDAVFCTCCGRDID